MLFKIIFLARKAYEALLRVSLLQPTTPTFQNFSEKVRAMAASNYNYSFGDDEEVFSLCLRLNSINQIFATYSGELLHRCFL